MKRRRVAKEFCDYRGGEGTRAERGNFEFEAEEARGCVCESMGSGAFPVFLLLCSVFSLFLSFLPVALLPLSVGVERYIPGEYRKHNNNYGFVSDEERNTPQAFSHFTYEASNHSLIVCDIQGVSDLYTV